MRVLLCGGGTAGHVMPAIAIAEIIEKSFPDSYIAFAGRTGGAENESYIKTNHTLYTVDISGINRSLSIDNVKSIFKVIKSGRKAKEIIKDFNPDVIIGTGGYVCYPFIRQGQRMNIGTVMHESNVYPGLVTRILGPRCDRLLLNLEGTRKHLRKTDNTVIVGNPTRKSFGYLTKSEAKQRLQIPEKQSLIISFGGSLGAEKLNETVLDLIIQHSLNRKDVYHVHATGKSHYDNVKNKYANFLKNARNVKIVPFIEDMPTYLTAADIAITRSGAITVSELAKSETPSILIPSPNVTANHQYMNAKYMQDAGASVMIEEKDLTTERLKEELDKLLESKETIHSMSVSAKRISPKNTDILIAETLSCFSTDKIR